MTLVLSPDVDIPPNGFLRAWSIPIVPFVGLCCLALVYLRGFIRSRWTRVRELPPWRAACFMSGLVALWLALASPIDALDDFLLSAHMIQHFILMSVAPPLIMLGSPVVPILRGLPKPFVRGLRPLFGSWALKKATHALLQPAVVWTAMNATYLVWHIPALFELTFRSEALHSFEHMCFFATSLVFWWIVVQPWPAQIRWPQWIVIPFLLGADLVNTLLSAFLSFSGRVLYPSYAQAPRVSGLSALQDQVAAGAEMWVLNSVVMLIPAILLTIRLLGPKRLEDSTPVTQSVRPWKCVASGSLRHLFTRDHHKQRVPWS